MSDHYKNLFEKFVNRNISPRELEDLLGWIERNEEFRDVRILESIWNNLENAETLDKSNAQRIRSKLQGRIQEEKSSHTVKVKHLVPWWINVAAGLFVIVLSYIGIMNYLHSDITVSSGYGEIVEVKLPDNSVVNLNANSSISYPREWQSQEMRTVTLDGEAYFMVSKDMEEHKKFVVQTKDLSVEVLGTEFNVNTRSVSTKVFLESGSVKLSTLKNTDSLMMVPGEEAGLDQNGLLAKSRPVDILPPTNWKDGSMILKDTRLSSIISEYENVFGEKIKVTNEDLLDQAYTIIFPITDKEKAISILQKLTDNSIDLED